MTERWSSRSIGSRLQHRIFYTIIAVCGCQGAYALLFWVVLWYTCRHSIRQRSRAYLKRRFPTSGPWRMFGHCWRLQWEFGKTLVDRAAAGITETYTLHCPDEDKERICSTLQEGKGLILLASHVGCWQMAAALLHTLCTVPVNVVMYRDAFDIDRQSYEHRGLPAPYAVIDPSDGPQSALAMLHALQRGEIVCIMGDRQFGNPRHVCDVPLLGDSITVPYSPYYLAAVSQAPVVVSFTLRTGPCEALHRLAAVIHVPSLPDRNARAYLPYVRIYAAALERCIGEHPYQFFNFYDMWENGAA